MGVDSETAQVAPATRWPDLPNDVEFFARIIDAIGHPIFVKDRTYRWVLLNEAFCTMVGYPRGDLLGKSDYDFFPVAEADFFRSIDVQVFATGNPRIIEEEPITDAHGQRHMLATTKVPLAGPDGAVTHLVGIIHDISRLKASEELLRQGNETLERRVEERTQALRAAQEQLVRNERLAVLGRLSGGLAHQIRNPLAAMKNAAYILARALPSTDPDVVCGIQVIHDEIRRADDFIRGLVEFARVRPAQLRPTSVREVVEGALVDALVPEEVRVTLLLEAIPAVNIDRSQVQSALSNLLRNAVEALSGSGSVTIEGRTDDRFVVLAVRDDGPGVAPEALQRLFEPLVTTKPDGTGLGLATARALIENQGGTLECVSTGPTGTNFTSRLPIAATED